MLVIQFVVGEGVSFASLHPFLHSFLAGSVLLQSALHGGGAKPRNAVKAKAQNPSHFMR